MNTISPDGVALAVRSKIKIPLGECPISAGEPVEVWNEYEMLDVNELITKGKDGIVAYKVTGDSMLEEIKPGYLIFVDTTSQPNNGDKVAASVNGKINVKIFKREPNGLFLISANSKYKPRQITSKDAFKILGVVVKFLGNV